MLSYFAFKSYLMRPPDAGKTWALLSASHIHCQLQCYSWYLAASKHGWASSRRNPKPGLRLSTSMVRAFAPSKDKAHRQLPCSTPLQSITVSWRTSTTETLKVHVPPYHPPFLIESFHQTLGLNEHLKPPPVYDLTHHVASKPLNMPYSELVAVHFSSFTLSRGPLMSRRTAKKWIKYLWSITITLLPYDGPVQLPPITSADISHVSSTYTICFHLLTSFSPTCLGLILCQFHSQTWQGSGKAPCHSQLRCTDLQLSRQRCKLCVQQSK